MGRAAVISYFAQRPVHSNICNPIRMESKMTLVMNNKMPQAREPLTTTTPAADLPKGSTTYVRHSSMDSLAINDTTGDAAR